MTRKVVRVPLPPPLAKIIENQSEATGLSEDEIIVAAYTDSLYKKGIVRTPSQLIIL